MYLKYCKNMKFEEAPDYMYLRQLFRILFRTLNYQYDYIFDWTLLKQKAATQAAALNNPSKTSANHFTPAQTPHDQLPHTNHHYRHLQRVSESKKSKPWAGFWYHLSKEYVKARRCPVPFEQTRPGNPLILL